MDYFLGNAAHGSVAQTLLQHNMDPGALRPWLGKKGRSFITITRNGKQVNVPSRNAATLRRDDWLKIDEAVIKAYQPRMRAVNDLRSRGLEMTLSEGMGKTILMSETQSDINEATVSMDGLRESERDRPVYAQTFLPLPIVHKDAGFSLRQIQVSRQGGSPLDLSTLELASRRVGEAVEQMYLGLTPFASFSYGAGSQAGTIQGLTNYSARNTKVLTNPTATAWTPAATVLQVLQMKAQSQADKCYGPWVLYCSPNWDVYMDNDYSSAKGDLTLRQRLAQIEGIEGVRTLDYLTGYQLILVQQTSDVVQLVVAMEITTIQWEAHGGMEQKFKVMTIMVPRLRSDYSGNCGIVHGTAP